MGDGSQSCDACRKCAQNRTETYWFLGFQLCSYATPTQSCAQTLIADKCQQCPESPYFIEHTLRLNFFNLADSARRTAHAAPTTRARERSTQFWQKEIIPALFDEICLSPKLERFGSKKAKNFGTMRLIKFNQWSFQRLNSLTKQSFPQSVFSASTPSCRGSSRYCRYRLNLKTSFSISFS